VLQQDHLLNMQYHQRQQQQQHVLPTERAGQKVAVNLPTMHAFSSTWLTITMQ
jgi:hypothetical protein